MMDNRANGAVAAAAAVIVIAAAIGFAADAPFMLPAAEAVANAFSIFSGWTDQAGAAGIAITIAIYATGVVVAFPSSVMTLAVTLLFGLWAAPIAWTGAVIGLAGAFFLSRGFLRRYMAWFCARYPATRGVETALERRGGWIVFLMRQSPVIPFAAQNYLFGMLGVSPAAYLIASALGIVPGTIAKVAIIAGAGTYAGGAGVNEEWLNLFLITFGIVATVLVMVVIGRAVRRELRREGIS